MELNMNTKRPRDLSLDDDDNFSNISRISYGVHNSLNSACNSDSECSGPISVRDMIQHYNNQLKKEESNQINHTIKYKINTAKRPHHHQSQHLLAATKSSYCGLNNYGSQMNANKRCADQMEHKSSMDFNDYNPTALTCCKNCTACTCCQNRSLTHSATTKMLSSPSSLLLQQNNENNKIPSSSHHSTDNNDEAGGVCIRSSSLNSSNKINAKDTRILAVENGTTNSIDATSIKPTILNDFCAAELNKDSTSNGLFKKHSSLVVVEKQKNRLLSTDSVEEAKICQQPAIETSYQSKTTIAKTSSGVRIIIDIFFDQERCANATDIVGSRVETDIPQSRILTEFQQQTMAVNTADTVTATASTSYQGL
ncbi:uncharacterized protein LOC135948910 [Calliphora vicina]|uniref:uncharacterized protein LOC135948910 n=1 Tax=Calliphora vicina TaxID=7373 RepID=UPI00325C1663